MRPEMDSLRAKIIQGGMGAAVSSWRLAQAVSRLGQLGVVSGTGLDQFLARRLQDGDEGGHMRRALASFPFQRMARRIAAIIALQPALDANYRSAVAATFDFSQLSNGGTGAEIEHQK